MPIYPTGKKKNGKQQYRVRVNYTDAGQYQQKERLCWGYKEALELEQRLRTLFSNDATGGEMLLNDFFAEYLKQKEGEIRETTKDKIKSNIENHVLPELGSLSLSEITPRAIANWKTYLLGKNLSIIYCRRIYGSLKNLLNYAVRIKFIPENPMKNIENFRDVNFQTTDTKLQFYTPEEFMRFAAAADAGVRNYFGRSIYMFFMIAFYMGLRKGEIHALRWDDIDGDVMRIRRSISQKVKGKSITETPPKNRASIRSLQIPKPLAQLLAQYRVLQQLHYPKKWNAQFRVIFGDRCISDTSISNYNIKWAKAAGLDPIRIHDYRHSHASLLANEGINIQEIARRLGHSNVQITWNTYSHLYPREEERAITILNRVTIHEFPTKKDKE